MHVVIVFKKKENSKCDTSLVLSHIWFRVFVLFSPCVWRGVSCVSDPIKSCDFVFFVVKGEGCYEGEIINGKFGGAFFFSSFLKSCFASLYPVCTPLRFTFTVVQVFLVKKSPKLPKNPKLIRVFS